MELKRSYFEVLTNEVIAKCPVIFSVALGPEIYVTAKLHMPFPSLMCQRTPYYTIHVKMYFTCIFISRVIIIHIVYMQPRKLNQISCILVSSQIIL